MIGSGSCRGGSTRNTERIDALQRTIIRVGGALTAATLGVLAAMLGMIAVLLATQL